MRIVSGKFKGRKIEPPSGLGIRPTTDRAREALFNILTHQFSLDELKVLDLFAGSGAMSVEFLSRGAKSVDSVELNRKTVIYLEKLADSLQADNWYIHQDNVLSFLNNTAENFDLIFLDPPYNLNHKISLIQIIFSRNLLLPYGVIILEHQSNEFFDKDPFFLVKRVYGNSTFSFFGTEDVNDE